MVIIETFFLKKKFYKFAFSIILFMESNYILNKNTGLKKLCLEN